MGHFSLDSFLQREKAFDLRKLAESSGWIEPRWKRGIFLLQGEHYRIFCFFGYSARRTNPFGILSNFTASVPINFWNGHVRS